MTNRLREARLALGLNQPQVSERLKEVEARADIGMVSRYEKGVCLPTREQLTVLESLYGMPRTELYDPADLDLLELPTVAAGQETSTAPVVDAGKKDSRGKTHYRKCYRISREFEASLPHDLLQVCGYSSWQSWHDAALKRLLAEYAARCRGIKKAGGPG